MPENKNPESDRNSTAANVQAEPNALIEDFWQSLKYSTVQKPYDGVSQLVNELGGDIKPRQLVEAPEAADVGSANWMAQQAGSGLAVLGGILALHKGIGAVSSSFGKTAATVALTESAVTGRITARSLAASGALYEGLTASSSADNFWKDRAINAGVGGLSIYTMAKMQTGLQGLTGVSKMAPEGVSAVIGRQFANSGLGVFSGATGGALAAETSSLLKHGKLASPESLAEHTLSGAFLGGTFSLAMKPGAEPVVNRYTGYVKPAGPEALPLKTIQPVEGSGPAKLTVGAESLPTTIRSAAERRGSASIAEKAAVKVPLEPAPETGIQTPSVKTGKALLGEPYYPKSK
jgi:hypothetical protein